MLDKVKSLENQGYEFEAADASFELLVRKSLGQYKPFFELVEYHVSIRKNGAHKFDACEATIKLTVNGEKVYTVAEGDGPVNALDAALRQALIRFYPKLADMKLVDYKVRIIDSTQRHRRQDPRLHRKQRRRLHMGHRRRQPRHHRSQLARPARQRGLSAGARIRPLI